MTTDTSAEGRLGSRWAGIARIGLGIVILLAGLWAVALIALWYGSDNLFVSGAHLKDPSAARLPAFVGGVVLVAGIVVLVMRRRFRGSTGLVALGCLAAVGVAAAALAVSAYPPIVGAKVLSIDQDTRYIQWSTDVPLTRVDGVSYEIDDRITLYGTYTDHGCNSSPRTVTLVRGTGEVVEVDRTPGSDPEPGIIAAPERDLEAHGLASERGELPFICLN